VLCLAAIGLAGLYVWDPALTLRVAQDAQQTAGDWVVDAETFVRSFFAH